MGTETEKPRSSFLKLLSEPGFNFAPYFDQAVVQWLERNMGDFLERAPEVCKYFIEEPEFRGHVAQCIPLTPEYEEHLVKFLDSFGTKDVYYDKMHAMTIMGRLVDAGKADLSLHCSKVISNIYSPELVKIIKTLSNKAVVELFYKMNLNHNCQWDATVRCAFIERLPEHLAVQIQPERWESSGDKDKARGISALAQKWPVADISTFLQRYGQKYNSLFCMNCAEKNAKSKPGYTLHRKVCDPNNEYPNIWTIIAQRVR